MQQNYSSFDIHVGQSYSFLVTMDQNASSDYYIVASARFVNESLWQRVTGVAVLRYSNSKGPATGPLPDPPNDFYDKTWSLNQALGVRFVFLTPCSFRSMISWIAWFLMSHDSSQTVIKPNINDEAVRCNSRP